jgi:hypothetical protein
LRACNPSIQEAEAGRSLEFEAAWSTKLVPGQPGLHRETLSRNQTKPKPNQIKTCLYSPHTHIQRLDLETSWQSTHSLNLVSLSSRLPFRASGVCERLRGQVDSSYTLLDSVFLHFGIQSAKPRLDCLIEVYRSCQEVLAHQKATATSL